MNKNNRKENLGTQIKTQMSHSPYTAFQSVPPGWAAVKKVTGNSTRAQYN